MQINVLQVWLKRLSVSAEIAAQRVAMRRAELWVASCLTIFFLIAGGLSLPAALVGLARRVQRERQR